MFGVVLDDANPPNIYLSATSAFGLHHAGNNWMPGMWGEGGPGGIYRLDAANGYAPKLLTSITFNGRPNSGPALGNLAYDRFNKQLFVSDLETGMIHRIRVSDGSDGGAYDHGTQGRTNFMDVETGQTGNLPPVAFDPNSGPRTQGCPGQFDRSPQCWNFAASGRRVWGLAVNRNPGNNETRLYYSVWSGPAFDLNSWNQQSEDDKRNSIWSVKLGPDGNFAGDVRREFIMPDFFNKSQDFVRAGYSQPVSDIHFATCGPRPIMLLAERGGIRNLGLAAVEPFATPHEARALRYELDRNGGWRAVGRYDVGFYDREKEGDPRMRANCAGGIAFGLGYNEQNTADGTKPDQFVWITGDSLCSPDGTMQRARCCIAPRPARIWPASRSRPRSRPRKHLTIPRSTACRGWRRPPSRRSRRSGANAQPTAAAAADRAELRQWTERGLHDRYRHQYRCTGPRDRGGAGAQRRDQDRRRRDLRDVRGAGELRRQLPAAAGEAIRRAAGHHYRFGSHSAYWSHSRFGSHNRYLEP